jgi:hypothetical protein
MRDGGADEAHGGEEIELEHRPPVIVGGSQEREAWQLHSGRRPARDVQEDIESAELLDSAIHDPPGSIGVHEVGGDVDEVAGERLEFGCGRARDGHDARTLLDQCAGDGQADALRGAGNDGDVAGQLKVHGFPPSC